MVHVALPARTEPRWSCAVQVAGGTLKQKTALGITNRDADGDLEIVAAASSQASIVDYRADQNGCVLTSEVQRSFDCLVEEPNDLAVGNVLADPAGAREIAALCATPGPVLRVFKVPPQVESTGGQAAIELSIPAAPHRVSHPVLADLDGDGIDEVVVLYAPAPERTTPASLRLLIWRPSANPMESTVDLHVTDEFSRDSNIDPVGFGPLVVPGARHDELIIAGYLGGLYLYSGTGPIRPVAFPGATDQSLIGPSMTVREGAGRVLIGVYGRSMRFVDLGMEREAPWVYNLPELLELLLMPRDVRIAVGRIDESANRTAVIAHNGVAYLFPVHPKGKARSLSLTDSMISATMRVLLANVDGKPGAEMIAYNPLVNRVYAIDHRGEALPGWPIEAGVEGTENRVVIEDLDRDGALELVVLSYQTVQVFSFGPKSFDRSSAPWPYPLRDQRLTAVNLDERAPL